MITNLIFSIFLVLVAKSNEITDYHLTPTSPPIAFLAQYYTLKLRVIGLSNPIFSYEGLPTFLTGSANGTIEGTPDQIGSYLVKVNYSSGNAIRQEELLLRVTSYLNQQLINNISNAFQVLYPNSSLTFRSGNTVNLTFQVQNGKNPFIWSITNLPPGLYADTKGNINGTFIQEGYYTISTFVSDMTGKSASSYFVFNVQPKNSNQGSKLIEVPNRNTNQHYNLTQVENQQIQATKATFRNAKKVYEAQNNTTFNRQKVTNTTIAMQQAQVRSQTLEKRVKEISDIKKLASAILTKAQVILSSAKNKLQLANTNYNNSKVQVQSHKKQVDQALADFQQAQAKLNKSSTEFILAQNESIFSALNMKIVQSANADAHEVYQQCFKTYSQAKKIIQDQQNTLVSANFVVGTARSILNLANQANDETLSNLKMAQNIFEKANSILNNTQKLVQSLRYLLNDAKTELEVSKFSLVQARNSLYVAQAVKAEADKATAIVSLQTRQNQNLSSINTEIFNGCTQGAYPTISGSAYILEKNSYSFKLSSGSILVFGSCSTIDENMQVGILMSFIGYLKEGYIHGLELKKYSV